MNYFIFNGRQFAAGTPVAGPGNRGLRYGDGLFETLKWKDGRIVLADEHFARLWLGLEQLGFRIPKLWKPQKFITEIASLISKNNLDNARIRLNCFRKDGGLYDAVSHLPDYTIEVFSLAESVGQLNSNGLRLCIFPDAVKSFDKFSGLKHNNCLPYITGALYAQEQHCNDSVILNSNGNICESTIANIFCIKDRIVSTPALSEGCVAGIMRKFLVEKLKELKIEVRETVISRDSLDNADEVFLTNSIYNIHSVHSIDTTYSNFITQELVELLNTKYGEVFA